MKNENEAITENTAPAPPEEEELNDEGVPRPARDPLNWLYTVISLLIFAAGYFGWSYMKNNVLLPYSQTLTAISGEAEAVLTEQTRTPLPPDSFISMARISDGTDNDRLHIRYENIGDPEAFAESIGFGYGDPEEDIRCTVFRGEGFDEDFVFADMYVSLDDPGLSCIVYEYEGGTFAEFILNEYPGEVKSIFRGVRKVKLHGQTCRELPDSNE